MVYIVERVLFKGFNGVYRRTCTVQSMYFKGLIVYIVERVLFKGFKCISPNMYCSKGLIVYIVELVLCKVFNGV